MLKAISLYTGVGGLDFGFEAAGFETTVAVEFDPIACRTIRLNRAWRVLEGDINCFTENNSKPILEAAGLRPGEADVLIGGPPCQPFSKSGYWARGDALRMNDPRASTLEAYLLVLEHTLPRTFLLENVQGLAYEGKTEGLDRVLAGIESINQRVGTRYEVAVPVQPLNAVEYGVPQLRQRLFLIGSRDGRLFNSPTATHGPAAQFDLLDNGQPYRTAWDAIGDLQDFPSEPSLTMGGKWADLLPTIPEGQNYLWHTKRGGGDAIFGWRTRYWSFLLKLAKDLPAWTIQAQPGSATGPFHWKNRKLSARELCRLQTFPDDLRFDCSRTDVQRMLGNAVPSLLAEVLAREIRRQLLGCPAEGALKLLPPIRRPIPTRGLPEPLPCKYRQLIGNHPVHPGEGLGPAALQRQKSRTLMVD